MRKGILILAPFIVFAVYMSRPVSLPAKEDLATSPIEPQTSIEQAAEEVSFSVEPAAILQGDPAVVRVLGLTGTSTIRALKFHNKPVGVFLENGRPAALIGVDLKLPAGSYPITLTMTDGRVIQDKLDVTERKIATAPLGIPDKLGGNTPESEQELINTLVEEGKIINSIKTTDAKLWNGPFRLPIDPPVAITDTYGYSRQTGGSSISHKGTDFRAAVGTSVYAMNSGRVAFVRYLRNYGNTIAIDHGLGLLTIYMHLSETFVREGEMVEKGGRIGKSGDTGYVLGPHLHLTVRIDNVSIDPEKFLKLLGEI